MHNYSLADLSVMDQPLLLSKPPKITFSCAVGAKANYRIAMENHFLSPKGSLLKKQNLCAGYTRTIMSALTDYSAFLGFVWDSVDFESENWREKSSRTQWTFAHGLKFSHYRTYPEPILPGNNGVESTGDFDIAGVDYSHLVTTPSVNLLYMLSWDVIGFEEMLSHITGRLESFTETSKPVDIDTVTGTYAHLFFQGCMEKESFFKNGNFSAAYLGLSAWKGNMGVLFEYQCLGELAVYNARTDADATNQTGSSYYFGKLLVDLRTGDLLRGDMTELITCVIVNKENKWIPQQKRRLVVLERLELFE